LTAGGLFAVAATFEPLGIMLALFGVWDWVETITDDADAMNKRLKLQQTLIELGKDLDAAEAEFEKRHP
jgi:hypothetical protein